MQTFREPAGTHYAGKNHGTGEPIHLIGVEFSNQAGAPRPASTSSAAQRRAVIKPYQRVRDACYIRRPR